MKRFFVIAAALAVSQAGFASTTKLHLLENDNLAFSPLGIPMQVHGVLQEEAPPPPPPPPEGAAAPEESIPSPGLVYGLMGGGGGAAIVGIILDVDGLFTLLGGLYCSAYANNVCTGAYLAVALVELVIGTGLIVAGAIVFFKGNSLRKKRNEMLAARNVSVNYNPMAKAPMLTYAFNF